MKLFPTRLVTIKLCGGSEGAEDEQKALNEAGIPNYLSWDGLFHRFELKVPEKDVQAAIKILGIEAHSLKIRELRAGEAIRCPQCRGVHVKALPPYLLIFGLLGSPVALFLAVLILPLGFAVAIGWVSLLYWLGPRIPKWQCIRCGYRWTSFPRYPIGS